MKPARLLLLTLGLILGLGAVVVGVGLTPAVQRWALLRAAASRPELKLAVAEVSVGFSRLSLAGLALEQNGLRVNLGRLDADYSLFDLVFRRRLQIQQLTASGLLVDASRLAPARTQAAAAAGPLAAPGLLGQIQLPVALLVENVRLEGRALLPGTSSVAAEYKITGGHFAPGQEGSLQLIGTMKDSAINATVAGLRAQLSLRATQTTANTFSRISLTAVVDATGRTISGETQLKLAAELSRDAAGEKYSLSVDTLLGGAAENVLAGQATLPLGRRDFTGQWSLKARTAQLKPFFLGGALPEFRAAGEGRFVYAPATQAVSLQGKIDVAASHLETIAPALRVLGAVKCSAQFDLDAAGAVARIHQLDVRLEGDQPVLELHAASAAELNFKDKRLQVGPTGIGEALDLNITGLPLAWVGQFFPGVEITGGLITGRMTVTAETDRLRARVSQPLRLAGVTIAQGGQVLLNQADLSLTAEALLTAQDLAVTISEFSGKTPAGDTFLVSSHLLLPVAPSPSVALTANYSADLPQLLAPWLPLGRVKVVGEVDLTQSGEKIAVQRLLTTVTDGQDAVLFRAQAQHPFTLDLAARRAVLESPGPADLLQLTLGHIPLARLPLDLPGTRLGGWVERGELILAADGEKLILRASSPVSLTDLSLSQDGRPVFTALRLAARPSVEMSGPAALKVQTGDLTLQSAAGASLFAGKGEITRTKETGLRGAITFNFSIPALATQPLFAAAQAVTAGQGSGEIRLALGEASQVEARLTINGLVAREQGLMLPVANLSFRAVAQNNGEISIQAPLLLDRGGQRSDLNFSLELKPEGPGYGVVGKLTGEQIELADALSLAGVFLAPAAPEGPEPVRTGVATPEARDGIAAWSRFSGTLSLDVKSVTHGTDWAMTGLTGLVKLAPSRLALEKLEAAFGEKSHFAAKAAITYQAGAVPYALTGDFSLNEFDAGKFFKALEPAKPATLEGLFNVQGQFTGEGPTLVRLAEHTRGNFALTSRQGVFRGLQRTSNRVSLSSKAVELGASVLGSIFGTQKVTRAAEKIAGSAYFVDQLAQSLGELNYDQFSVKLVRDTSLNVTLEDISLVSPEIRLVGQGTVTYEADKPLLEQPLNSTLAIAARGKLEQLLGKLKLLDGTRDELGYAKTNQPVTLGGSLAKPDPTAFFTRIATAKISEFLAPEN